MLIYQLKADRYISSTAQGGDESLKNWKRKGEVCCYDSWMEARTAGATGG